MCGYEITGPVIASTDNTVRGKPVHQECEDKARAWVRHRIEQKKARKAPEVTTVKQQNKRWLLEENRRLQEAQGRMRQQKRSGRT